MGGASVPRTDAAPIPAPVRAYVGIGANLGDARAAVLQAMAALGALPGTREAARSSLWRSAPVDAAGPDFVNAVMALDTTLSPEALLAELQRLEHQAGRERPYRHAPRTLDLDLLLHGEARRDTPALVLPHPRLASRAFVLRPLAEIDPARVSPAQLAAVAAQGIERLAP